MLSKRIGQLKPSPTLALAAKAKQLKAQGEDVISLTVGEPDWPTYDRAKERGQQAINENKTTYTPASGIPELKAAIAELVSGQLNVEVETTQVTVGAGAKFIIYGALSALLDPGDEVIIPSPYWVSYPAMVELAGGIPKVVNCGEENGFKMTAAQLEAAIGPKTKLVMLNSPSNPTGAEYNEVELKALVEVLQKNPQVCILSDDIYNQLSFNSRALSPHILNIDPSLFSRCVSINGMSKAYSMTGWRIGWAVGPAPLIKAIASFQSQTTGAPCSISQWASVSAIQECGEDVKESLAQLKERKAMFTELIQGVPGMKPFSPEGAFYLWVNIEPWLKGSFSGEALKDSRQVSSLLLDQKKVAVVPGQEFGMDGYLRLSFAASPEQLKEAADRFKSFASEISGL